jgi:glycosyltransferase involved in cell wall biosynthesis
MNNQTWSVIILCYNEEGSIKRVIKDAQGILKVISPDKNEIVLINDGSSDNSGKIIEDLIKNEFNKY